MLQPKTVKESVIRLMTRLSIQYNAINLSQGFPNEPPPYKLRLALANAVLTGNAYQKNLADASEKDLTTSLVNLLTSSSNDSNNNILTDELNQYSPPMGRADSRKAIANHYKRLYDYDVSEDNITITLGATEAVASALRCITSPGDQVVIFEPYHELYPSQCNIFYCEPTFVTLRASEDGSTWNYDYEELKAAISHTKTKALVLNTPHNPTGKVFKHSEIKDIVSLCIANDVYIISDEIYEWMTYTDDKHILIQKEFPEAADLILCCNSLGKSASATGWRVGWCIHPSHLSNMYRGVHDQLCVQSPHPMQYASLAYFNLPDDYFKEELRIRYKSRVEMLANTLAQVGFGVVLPQGAYYLFVNYKGVDQLKDLSPMEAAMYLIKEVGVAAVPGDNFYSKSLEGQNYLRFAACRSNADIEAAINLLSEKLSPI